MLRSDTAHEHAVGCRDWSSDPTEYNEISLGRPGSRFDSERLQSLELPRPSRKHKASVCWLWITFLVRQLELGELCYVADLPGFQRSVYDLYLQSQVMEHGYFSLWVKLISSDKGWYWSGRCPLYLCCQHFLTSWSKKSWVIYLFQKWKRWYLLQTLTAKIKRYFGFVNVCGEPWSKSWNQPPFLHWMVKISMESRKCAELYENHEATFHFL